MMHSRRNDSRQPDDGSVKAVDYARGRIRVGVGVFVDLLIILIVLLCCFFVFVFFVCFVVTSCLRFIIIVDVDDDAFHDVYIHYRRSL